MYRQTQIKPFDLARFRREAEKLKQTEQPYLGFLFLGALAVLDERWDGGGKLAELENCIEKARMLPHDTDILYSGYCNALVRLGAREAAASVVAEYAVILTDSISGLKSCLEYTRFTGQIGLAEDIIARLEGLGKDMDIYAQEMRDLKSVIDESSIRVLLARAGELMRGFGLVNIGSERNFTEDGFFLNLLLLPDSDKEKAWKCDIALTDLKVRYSLDNGIDLSRFILGCDIAGDPV